jgi:hypothetical protein
MTWQVTWSLILGFTLSAIIAALVRKSTSPGCCRMTGPRASGPHPLLAKIWGPIIGPLVAVASFVCSIGRGRLPGRDPVRRPAAHPDWRAERSGRHGRHQLELHKRAQHRLLIVAALLVWRFLTTGGRAMLAMMGGGPDDMGAHDHDAHHADDHGTHDAHRSS